ncbi:acetylornithine aminotransferase, partial [Ascosphaera acerosa]
AAAEAFVAARAPYAANTYAKPDIVFTRGKGPLLWDLQGRRYTDFTAGIGVCALGHGDARVAELVAEQAGQLLHTSNLFHNYWSLELARALVAATRTAGAFPAAAQVFLSNSGTEANEAAIKFARLRARSLDPSGAKSGIVSFHGSFHGRTFGALSATPTEKYRAPFAPMVPGFSHAAFNDVAALRDAVTPATAGVIVEPIQGEGGINPATPEFLHALRARCDEVGAVLIFDEIQCGLGRTGSLWAHANKHAFGLAGAGTDGARQLVFPDILTSAKALGNGLPIGATLISEEVGSHIQPGHHGTTYGGGPLACAVATHVVNRLCSPEVMSNVAHRSAQFDAALQQLADRYPQAIKEKRVRGLMIGLQLHDAYVPKISQIVQYCRDEGLLILTAGTGVIRLLPPLIISKLRVAEGCEIMERAIRRVVAETEGGAAH